MLELITQQQAELRAMQADLVARAEDAATWKAKAELLGQQARSLERQVDELRAELNRARRPWWRKPLG
jgi:predicted  nucleic acid-binding Zn-ribbon protein